MSAPIESISPDASVYRATDREVDGAGASVVVDEVAEEAVLARDGDAVSTRESVVAVRRRPRVATKLIVAWAARQVVVSAASGDVVVARSAHHVLHRRPDVVELPGEAVVSRSVDGHIHVVRRGVAGTGGIAHFVLGAGVTREDVCAVVAEARTAPEIVVPRPAVEPVVGAVPGEQIVRAAAGQVLDIRVNVVALTG